jgi:hypothetical protein
MPKFFFPLFIFFENNLVLPFFSFINSIYFSDSIILTLAIFCFIGLVFSVLSGTILYLLSWWFFQKVHHIKLNPFFILLISFGIPTLYFIHFIAIFFALGAFFLGYLDIQNDYVNVILPVLMLILSFFSVTLSIQKFIQYKTKKTATWGSFFHWPLLVTSASYMGALFVLFACFLWFITGNSICSASHNLYVSSGYAAHTAELCFKREDTSECPQTEDELRAFRPKDYDELLVCYDPIKTDWGVFLESKIQPRDLF